MKTLEPMRIPSSFFKDQAELISASYLFLVQNEIAGIIAAWRGESKVKNSISNALYDAVSRGTITFKKSAFGFYFAGAFDAAISRELKNIGATWDSTGNSFFMKTLSPNDKVALDIAERNNRILIDRLDAKLQEISASIEVMKTEDIAAFDVDDKQLSFVDKQMIVALPNKEKYKSIAVALQATPDQITILKQGYVDGVKTSIKDLSLSSVNRLREMVYENQASGLGSSTLVKKISSEFGMAENRAVNIARHETSLFMSKYRQCKARNAGFTKYIWRTSHDPLVRPTAAQVKKGDTSNNHRILDGKVFSFDNPPVVDVATGRRANAGEDYNCRCVAAIVIEE